MPKSKREKEVSLTKIKKKTKEQKMKWADIIRNCVDTYENLFLFEVKNMCATKFVEIRQKFKLNSRFFFGKNNVLAIALGRDPATEYAKGLSKISNLLKGECGLMFTNENKEEVIEFFKNLRVLNFARWGEKATGTVELDEGPLMKFPFSMEPQLRKLGLPTKLDKGVVTLVKNHTVCKEGDILTVDQSKLLKLLDYKMGLFQLKLTAHWSKSKGFSNLV